MNTENTDTVVLPYRHPVVRDLAWVMVSPGLLCSVPEGQALVMDDWCRRIHAKHENHLRELDDNPAPLLDALSKNKSNRLGIYFEHLLHYWLKNILCVQELQHNVPVFQPQKAGGKRTLGEFDFLFRVDEKKPVQHWEATVKFYLQKKDDEGRFYQVGPEGRDRFDIKLNRLFQHQLGLANLPEAKECLRRMETGEQEPVHSVVSVSCALSANHHKGWWLHWGEMPVPVTVADVRWMILPRFRWLSPVCHGQAEEMLMDAGELRTYCEMYFGQQGGSLLVAELAWQSTVWLEVSRGFILAPASG